MNYKSDINASKYFEGQITYDIEYTPYDTEIESRRIKELIGSKMILTFKKGNYKKSYYSPSGKLLQERVLKLKDKKSYLRTYNSDTIFWFDITKNDSKTSFKVLSDTTILNHPCTVIKTTSIISGNHLDNKSMEVDGLFIYAIDLPVNPNWYKEYKEGKFNEIVKSGKGIVLATVNKGIYWEQTISARIITERKVRARELEVILKDHPLKQL
ncbi:MAG: hypothetical protein GYB35_04315 [Algicola sp.]|nr:hypothetical protein [Algicola sp.]